MLLSVKRLFPYVVALPDRQPNVQVFVFAEKTDPDGKTGPDFAKIEVSVKNSPRVDVVLKSGLTYYI